MEIGWGTAPRGGAPIDAKKRESAAVRQLLAVFFRGEGAGAIAQSPVAEDFSQESIHQKRARQRQSLLRPANSHAEGATAF
jgi:hypothetical protein